MANARFIKSSDVEQVQMPIGAFRRTMGTTEQMMLLEIYFPRNTVGPEHSHVHEQIGYVVHGQIEFTIGGETRVCEAGDSYAIPSNVPHSAHALIDTVIVEIFSPPREDFR